MEIYLELYSETENAINQILKELFESKGTEHTIEINIWLNIKNKLNFSAKNNDRKTIEKYLGIYSDRILWENKFNELAYHYENDMIQPNEKIIESYEKQFSDFFNKINETFEYENCMDFIYI